MINRASVTDVLRNFSDYINRVVYRRERFVLIRGGREVAELSPVPSGVRLGDLPAIMASLPRLDPEDIDAFQADIDEARRELGSEDRDPWAS
jgi:hypothetical protein